MREMHDIQNYILECLLEGPLSFSKVNDGSYESDQFSFHLRQLQKHGFVTKSENLEYSLSTKGKLAVMELHPRNHDSQRAILALRFFITKGNDVLVQQRRVEPFKGFFGTPGGRIVLGSLVKDAARMKLKDETGLSCDVTYKGLLHVIDKVEGGNVQDKYFLIFAGTASDDDELAVGSTGKNVWMDENEVLTQEKVHSGLDLVFRIGHGESQFEEHLAENGEF